MSDKDVIVTERKTRSGLRVRVKYSATADKLPDKLPRYYHPSHEHRMFINIVRFPQTVTCANLHCQRNIQFGEIFLNCQRCDYDLCGECFRKPLASNVPAFELAESDNEIEDSTTFRTFRYPSQVKAVTPMKMPSRSSGVPSSESAVPAAPQNPQTQVQTFAGVANRRSSAMVDEEDTDEDYEDEDEMEDYA